MKPGYVPEGMTTTPAKIAARNIYIDGLCTKVKPYARDAFRLAVERQSSDSAEMPDVDSVLSDLLASGVLEEAEPHERKAFTLALQQLTINEGEQISDEEIHSAWVERRSSDLALDVARFWTNLGEDEISRREAGTQFLKDLTDGKESKAVQNFSLIASRFWLEGKEAGKLLNILNTPQPG
ncbi:MAG TPA: hypothetical protein VIF12_07870 [Micavibrio sp.]|jgi:hypothetical protein